MIILALELVGWLESAPEASAVPVLATYHSVWAAHEGSVVARTQSVPIASYRARCEVT
jgi:hypothetical protein